MISDSRLCMKQNLVFIHGTVLCFAAMNPQLQMRLSGLPLSSFSLLSPLKYLEAGQTKLPKTERQSAQIMSAKLKIGPNLYLAKIGFHLRNRLLHILFYYKDELTIS